MVLADFCDGLQVVACVRCMGCKGDYVRDYVHDYVHDYVRDYMHDYVHD